jgi:hypothetical protein
MALKSSLNFVFYFKLFCLSKKVTKKDRLNNASAHSEKNKKI